MNIKEFRKWLDKDKEGRVLITTVADEKPVEGISTGSIWLDLAIGVGGLPMGRITQIYGKPGIGKTTLTLGVIAKAVRAGKTVCYIDTENGLDWTYIRAICGEDFVKSDNMMLMTAMSAEDSLDIAAKAIGAFDIIVIDSIAMMATEKELVDGVDKDNIGRLAKKLTTWLKTNTYSLKLHNTTFIAINQVRADIGSYVPRDVAPGGNALEHQISVSIHLHPMSKAKSEIKDANDILIGRNVRFIIEKNKVGPPSRSGEIPFVSGKGVDEERSVIDCASYLGIIRQAGAFYKYPNVTVDPETGEIKEELITLGQGYIKAVDYLLDPANKEVLDKIRQSCYDSYAGQ
jgi:recombination protein RecA